MTTVEKLVIRDKETNKLLIYSIKDYKFTFTNDIERATKFVDWSTANMIMQRFFNNYTEERFVEFEVVPLTVTYSLGIPSFETYSSNSNYTSNILFEMMDMLNAQTTRESIGVIK